MILDVFTTEPHYAQHVLPVWNGLDDHERGIWYTGGGGEAIAAWVREHTRRAFVVPTDPPDADALTLVASHTDYRYTPRGRPVIYVEHGAGQSYQGVSHGGYSGGENRERVVLFLCPNERTAQLNRDAYPGVPAVAVGSPKLDRWHGETWPGHGFALQRPIVAFSSHWDCQITPETRTGFWEFSPALPALMERYEVLGHGHPRGLDSFKGTYTTLGIEIVPDFDDVLARADCYIVDNSSTAFEWCAVAGRPIVSLQPSFYRTDVHHGLRFWEAAPRPVCNVPADLADVVAVALEDKPRHRLWREHCARAAYDDLVDGQAAPRAVTAIRELG
jgi:hypothetical protein